jgi:hypothetical protein
MKNKMTEPNESIHSTMNSVIGKDFPNIVCLLDLLAEHPAISGSNTLTGSVVAIKAQVVEAWEKLELTAA